VWIFCASSHDLLYLYKGVVVLWFFIWSSTFTCTWVWLFCSSSRDLLLYLHMGVMTINFGILLRSNLTLIHSFLPSVEQQKKNCTSSQVVSFALTHTIGHNQYLIIRKFQTLFASCIALLNLVTFFWGMRCRWRWGIVIRQSDSETITLGFFRYMSGEKV
jgi:hypothetical protein